jgi:hypothetical protein
MVFAAHEAFLGRHAACTSHRLFTKHSRTARTFLTQPARRNYVHGRRTTDGTCHVKCERHLTIRVGLVLNLGCYIAGRVWTDEVGEGDLAARATKVMQISASR